MQLPFVRLLIPALLCACSAAGQPEFYLHDGDRVVFYGDSITDQRLYTVFAETFVTTRFPGMRVNFTHSGWSGDRVTGGLGGAIDVRLDRDVFAHDPTVITVMLGMNDAEYRPFDDGIFNIFANGYRHILARIEAAAPRARVTLLAPSPYDDVTRPPAFEGGYNSVLLRYGKFVSELGRASDREVVDLNGPVVRLLKSAADRAPEPARKLIPDRVHPSPGVHLVMAKELLRAWGAPAVVSLVEMDAASGKLTKAENTAIDSIARDMSAIAAPEAESPATESCVLAWTEADRALPMPLSVDDETVRLALAHSDFMDALNREMLKVTGLRAGRYRLEIDGQAAGIFDARELGDGVNLAARKTPMSEQARTVYEMIFRRNYLRAARINMVDNSLREYHPVRLGAALDALKSLEDEMLSIERAAAQPRPHRFQLMPAAGGQEPAR